MTISAQVPLITYVGNGISTAFTYPFYLLDSTHIRVYVNGALQAANTYTVNNVGNPTGGTVLLSAAPAIGIEVSLARVVPLTQLVDYQPYESFPAEVNEQALDKLTMIAQQGAVEISRSVRAPILEQPGAANLVLPVASARANFVLGFDLNGNVVMVPQGVGPGITAHGLLTGLSANDHPQYLLVTAAQGTYLPLAGGTMTGDLILQGNPPTANSAVNKNYVDSFVGSVLTKSVNSNATGDAQVTVQAAWNAQANASAITRAANEIIYYRWPSSSSNVYRYVGSQQGPTGWGSTAADWVAAAGIVEAPLDGTPYARKSGNWVATVEKAGGAYTGKVQGPVGAAAAADLARTDEVAAKTAADIAAHVALANPHNQYQLLSGKAAANGYASLDAGVKVPVVQIPDLSGTYATVAGVNATFIPLAQKAAAGGVATLDGTGKVPIAQIPPVPSAGVASGARGSGRNIQANNAGGSFATGYSLSADEIVVDDGAGNKANIAIAGTTGTIGTAGLGGLDTGAIAANTWYYVWAVYNGTTAGTIFSLSATAPTMPAGYTYKALVAAFRTNGSSQMVHWRARDRKVYLGLNTTVLSSGVATVETNLNLDPGCPPAAIEIGLNVVNLFTGAGSGSVLIRIVSGVNFLGVAGQNTAADAQFNSTLAQLPLFGTAIMYLVTAGAAATVGITNFTLTG